MNMQVIQQKIKCLFESTSTGTSTCGKSQGQFLAKCSPWGKAGVSFFLAGSLMLNGAFAYFSDTETVTNHFLMAPPLEIEVIEENWDTTDANQNGVPDAAEGIVSGSVVPKAPTIKNVDGTEAWVFAQVTSPYLDVLLFDETTGFIKGVSQASEVLLYDALEDTPWVLLREEPNTDNPLQFVRTYAYTVPLEPGETTAPLFSQVTLANLIEGELSDPLNLDVCGLAIQTHGFETYQMAWEALESQQRAVTNLEGTNTQEAPGTAEDDQRATRTETPSGEPRVGDLT